MAKVIRWQGDGTFDQEVVGESHYQDVLRRFSGGERRKHTTARLICESNNPYDKLAVRVEIGGQTIGHLAQNEARAHRVLLKKAGQSGAIVELPAVIVTGERGVSGVYLSVVESDVSAMLNAPKVPTKPLSNRVLIGLVIVLACVGITLMVIGFGGAGGPGVQPTPTQGKLSDIIRTVVP